MNEDKILDQTAFELAYARLTSAPLELTPRDFEQLEIVSPGLVTAAQQAQAFARQEKSRLALQVKSATPKKPRLLTQKDLETWIVDALAEHWLKPFTEKMQALEQANKDLQNRVLELEAQRAADAVDHVER
jgi:hypothetical protein